MFFSISLIKSVAKIGYWDIPKMSPLEAILEMPRSIATGMGFVAKKPKEEKTKQQLPYVSQLNSIFNYFEQTSIEDNYNKIENSLNDSGLTKKFNISLDKKEYLNKLNKLREGIKFINYIVPKDSVIKEDELINLIKNVQMPSQDDYTNLRTESARQIALDYVSLANAYKQTNNPNNYLYQQFESIDNNFTRGLALLYYSLSSKDL